MANNVAYKRKPRKSTFRRRKPYSKSKKATPMKAMVKTIVKKAMARNVENKKNSITNTSLGFYQQGNVTITSSYVNNIIPSIPQTVTESGRIGNNVTVKSLVLNGYLRMNSTGLSGEELYSPNQFLVRIFIGRLKLTNSSPITANLNVLLRTGINTFPFDSGTGLSLCRRINKEEWTIYYDKIHKIGVSQPRIISTTTNSIYTTNAGISNNDFKLCKLIKIDCTKMIPKKFVYTDAGTFPTNTGLYIFGGLVDSLTSDVGLSSPAVMLDYDIEMSYEDA